MLLLRVIALVVLSIGALLSIACGSTARAIRPVIYASDDDAAAAMKSAPLIVLIRIAELKLTGDTRVVVKPPEVGGPMTPTIPLDLARINAEVLLTVRGQARTTVEFYSWIWASGSHGGPRLFHPNPGAVRVVFLREEGGYLHTVGDYPSYDLELRSAWVRSIISAWNSGQGSDGDPVERLVALRLRAELEGLSENQLREDFGDDGPRVNHHWIGDMFDLVRVAGPFFVMTQLDDICHNSRNSSARFAACYLTAQYFPGRCEAYELARRATTDDFGGDFLAKLFRSCQPGVRAVIEDVRSGRPPQWGFFGSNRDPKNRREALRVYAAAMNVEVHRVACEVAATTPEARDIPECRGRRNRSADPPLVQLRERTKNYR